LTAFEACGKPFQYRRLAFGVTNGISVFQRMTDSVTEKQGRTQEFFKGPEILRNILL